MYVGRWWYAAEYLHLYETMPLIDTRTVSNANIKNNVRLKYQEKTHCLSRGKTSFNLNSMLVKMENNTYLLSGDRQTDNIYSTYSNWLHIVFMQHNHLKKKII